MRVQPLCVENTTLWRAVCGFYNIEIKITIIIGYQVFKLGNAKTELLLELAVVKAQLLQEGETQRSRHLHKGAPPRSDIVGRARRQW